MAIKSYYETQYGLRKNPFPSQATYGEDTEIIYVPEMFGPQRDEFLRKFILAPLEDGQPLIGAVWSVSNRGDPSARGFGKSTLMAEEAKIINQDFGKSTLISLGISEEDASANPVLAGYVSFVTKAYGGILSIDSAAFNLARFILRIRDDNGISIHTKLRERAAAKLVSEGKAVDGSEDTAIVQAIRDRFRKLAVTIDIRNLLEDFMYHLGSPDTEALERFLVDDVGTWHHDRNGLKYLQILVAFSELAGIEYFTFFIDQVEDFTSMSGPYKIRKNVKFIRDALIETEPFSSRASFVFQLHPMAYHDLKDAWIHEHLPSLEYDDPLTEPVVVVLKGLDEFSSARLLAERILNDPTVVLPNRKDSILPFTEASLRAAWEATKRNPRDFLRILNRLLELGNTKKIPQLDETFVLPKLERMLQTSSEDEEIEEAGIDERTA